MPASSTAVHICNRALGRLGEERILTLEENTPAGRSCYLHYQPTVDEVLRSHRWNFAQARVVLAPGTVTSLTVPTTLSQTVLTIALGLIVGQSVTGTGIPANTVITAVTPGVSFYMSNAATVVNASNLLTFGIYHEGVTQPAFGWTYAYVLPTQFIRALEINDSDDDTAGAWTIEGLKLLTNEDTVNLVYVTRNNTVAQWDTLFQEAVVLKLATKLATTLRGSAAQVPDLMAEYERMIGPLARRVDANEGRERKPLLPLRSQFVAARYQGV
jgi:hypothetical protein